jgi:hypothetical protein
MYWCENRRRCQRDARLTVAEHAANSVQHYHQFCWPCYHQWCRERNAACVVNFIGEDDLKIWITEDAKRQAATI